jgi:hypothetical protein
MFRIHAPILVLPTAEAREALGTLLQPAALAAHREIALAAKGLEIAHLQFVFGALTLALCSRVRHDGIAEIEIGLGDARLPKSAVTHARAGLGGGGDSEREFIVPVTDEGAYHARFRLSVRAQRP